MKQLNNIKMYRYYKLITLMFLFGVLIETMHAQDSAALSPTLLSMSYFMPANNVPYLEVTTKKKTGRKFEPVNNIPVNIFFGEAESKNLLGNVITDAMGKGRIGLSPSFKNAWDSLSEFKFVAEAKSTTGQAPLTTDITIKKAILKIDTTSEDGTRIVTAELKEQSGSNWVAVKNIDMKLSVKRMLGNLSVGDEDVFTSDSTGQARGEYKRDSLPGDEKGNIILVAKVDDNDTYGTLVTEKKVNWGTQVEPAKNFFAQRTLWSTRLRTPLWLLITVYSIVILVWGTIIYLVFQLIKIKKLGKTI